MKNAMENSLTKKTSCNGITNDKDLKLADDEALSSLPIMMDLQLPLTVEKFFDIFWSDASPFLKWYSEKCGDIDVVVSSWQIESTTKENNMNNLHYRTITLKHPPSTKYPGLPKYAPTTKKQLYYTPTSDINERLVIQEENSVSNIPFAGYFLVKSRWVITKTSNPENGNEGCRVQVGTDLEFIKSTWLKGQIVSQTLAESKVLFSLWSSCAREYIIHNHGVSCEKLQEDQLVHVKKLDTPPLVIINVQATILCAYSVIVVMLIARVAFALHNLNGNLASTFADQLMMNQIMEQIIRTQTLVI